MFDSIRIGSFEVVNRLVRSATAERGADYKGRVTDELVEMYRILARGGVGTIITGHAYVHPYGKTNPAMTGVYSDEMIPGLTKIAQAVHRNSDAKVVLQINHAGRVTSSSIIEALPAGPSPIPVKMSGEKVRQMSSVEIDDLVDCFAQAAVRAQEAGFDAVQIHCAHGYLISQFLSKYTNRRDDKWGGSPENRRRFLKLVVQEMKSRTPDFPLWVKINSEDFVPDGVTIEEFIETSLLLEQWGISAVEISGGIPEAGNKSVRKGINGPDKEGYFLPAARALKTAGLKIPVITVGGFRTKAVVQEALQRGDTDLVALSRPLITEPDLPLRWKKGEDNKSRCIACNKCLRVVDEITHCVQWEATEKDKFIT